MRSHGGVFRCLVSTRVIDGYARCILSAENVKAREMGACVRKVAIYLFICTCIYAPFARVSRGAIVA